MLAKNVREALSGFGDFVREQLAQWKVPGCAIAIVQGGKVVMSHGFGYRDAAKKLPATPDTLFAIGSCTKAFTTMALGMLVDEGKLDWDKPVRDYAPDFRLHDAFTGERVTTRDLVTHRTGLPRHDFLWYGAAFSRDEIFARLRYLEPSKDLRQIFQYNNLMYLAAGVLIERLAGKSWEEFVQARIFQPLSMTHSNFSIAASECAHDHAMPYRKERATDEVKAIPFRNIDSVGPAGSINSTASDMARWLALHLNKGRAGGKQLISEANLAQMHTPQMAISGASEMDNEFGQDSYGLGWGVGDYRGHVKVQHGGGIDGFLSLTTLLPRDGIGVFAVNNLTFTPFNEIVTYSAIDRLLGLRHLPFAKRWQKRADAEKATEEKGKAEVDAGRKPNTQPSHTLEDYAGDFEHPGYGQVRVTLQDGQLHLHFNTASLPLIHYHYDVFVGEYAAWEAKYKVVFASDVDGLLSSVSLPLEPAVKPIVFTRVASAAMRERSFLESFVGVYEMGDWTLAVSLQGDHALIATPPNQPPFELEPVEGTRFKLKALDGFSLEFKRSEAGAVTEAVFRQVDGTANVMRRRA